MADSKLIVLVGETASGKTALAIKLAQQFNGEIICADSSTVRREVDIGSAKPTKAEQAAVRHHLLDVIGPCDKFTAAQFKKLANEAIADITARGKLPIMAGGSGLYIDGVVYDYQFSETVGTADRKKLRPNTLVIGLKTERESLKQRISQRVDAQLAAGLEAEVSNLVERYGWGCEALRGIAYAQWKEYFEGAKNLAEIRQKIIKANVELAKRQRTWFKRNKSIHWFSTPVNQTTIVDSITTFLNN